VAKNSNAAVSVWRGVGGVGAWVFFLTVATLVLSACEGGGKSEDAPPTASLRIALDQLVGSGSRVAARIGTLPDAITRVTVDVRDAGGQQVAFADITSSDTNDVTLSVPSGVALKVTGTAYAGNAVAMQGSSDVAALDSGASSQVQVTLIGSPINTAAVGTTAEQLSAGGRHTCLIRNNGSLWCWGENMYGQLGSGVASDVEASPVRESTLDTTWEVVEAGGSHTCALRRDGSLWCWGSNFLGQLGDGNGNTGDNTLSPAPVREATEATDWRSVSAGDKHTCAIKTDGSLWCWGNNSSGQLGNGQSGTGAHQAAPVRESSSAADWDSVVAGGYHTCAVKTNRTLWCWGYNFSGQLGVGVGASGATENKSAPTQVGTDTNWTQVDAGGYHTCAVKTVGTLWCWGNNFYGQVGDGTSGTANNRNVPMQEQTASGGWTGVATGGWFTCALRGATARFCWGRNTEGEFGNGTRVSSSTPSAVDATPQNWTAFAAGGAHACGLLGATKLACWGRNVEGQLGLGEVGLAPSDAPRQVGTERAWRRVTVGDRHACGTDSADALWCWGRNDQGQLGTGAVSLIPLDRAQAVATTTATAWTDIAADFGTTCGVHSNGTLWCWGDNSSGQLGNNDAPNDSSVHAQEATSAQNWSRVAIQATQSCGVRADGTLWCWGAGVGIQSATPARDASAATTWNGVSVGQDHVCAVRTDGTLWCFGANLYGQLGNGASGEDAEQLIPVQEVTAARDWVQVSAGFGFTCATKTNGSLWCWGRNNFGQLGNNPSSEEKDSAVPVREASGAADWTSVSAGHEHVCATRGNGTLWCWGGNAFGQLGVGGKADSPVPVQERSGATNWSRVAAGLGSTCGVRADASLWCWGDNAYGQLGDGFALRDLPTEVIANINAP
jgi:alpha-tubulin suppressor-like RCC1 family protein